MLYTTGQVTKSLNISRPTLYKLCQKHGIKPKKVGDKYRFSEIELKLLLGKSESSNIEEKFVNIVNDVWMILKQFSEDIWGIEGEQKLKEILEKNKSSLFILNLSNF